MKKFFGKFIIGLSKFLDKALGLIVNGLSYVVNLLSSISVFLVLIGIGLLTLSSFLAPLLIGILIFHPGFWLVVFVFFIVPFLGKKFISFLRYINYSLCEIFCWETTEVIHHLKNIKENMKELKKNNVKEKEKKDKEENRKNGKEDLMLLMNIFPIREVSIQAIRDIIKILEQVTIHIATLKINLKMLVGF